MTRKCILCKETNYRNTYSFFSAPKDPETRKKWQSAIAIENYSVTDDTYVCSKHFHKDDIITHWVSGVPPHVITIKYKKCRLRPGAVPGRNYHLEENVQTEEHSDDSDVNIGRYSPFKVEKTSVLKEKERDFLIPRMEEKLPINCNKSHEIASLRYHFPHTFVDYSYISKKNSQIKVELSENDSNPNNELYKGLETKESPNRELNETKQTETVCTKEECFTNNTNSMENISLENVREKQNRICIEDFYSSVSNKILNSSSTIYNDSEKDNVSMLKHKIIKKDTPSKEKSTDNNFKITKNMYIENQIANSLNYNQLDKYYPICSDIDENEMLFEDLLEVCTEVLLPRGWSCLVTSKGHTTTIVYLYMGMTKSGMPFTEKQVFIKSDMILHCTAVNKEINPLIHNLIREGKHLRVQNLVDIEEFIDEFDQRIVCQGIYNTQGFQEINYIKLAYKDGIKWRHALCPLLVNNDSLRCTRCISLSHTLKRNSRSFLSFPCNRSLFIEKQQKLYSIRQKYKRTRKQDRRYEFIKIFK